MQRTRGILRRVLRITTLHQKLASALPTTKDHTNRMILVLKVFPRLIPLRALRLPRHAPLRNINFRLARRARRLASKVEACETESCGHDTEENLPPSTALAFCPARRLMPGERLELGEESGQNVR